MMQFAYKNTYMIEIISLIVTIVLGLPSLLIFLKQKKTKLIYLENKQINIQEDLLKNFKDVTIKYREKEINSNLIFIKGYIICDGDKDITSKNNYVEIISPEDTVWVDFKIISKSKGLTETSNFKDNTAIINFDLLKSKENYEFEGIIEKTGNAKSEDVNLKFFHRIPNLNNIETLKSDHLKNSYNWLLMSTLLMLFGLFVLWTEYSIRRYDLAIIDYKTKKELNSIDFILSKNFDETIGFLEKETNGVYLLFRPSKKYDIVFDDYDKNFEKITIKKTIYFKKNITFGSIFSILISIILLSVSAFLYFLSFYLLSRKKYLKYISEK